MPQTKDWKSEFIEFVECEGLEVNEALKCFMYFNSVLHSELNRQREEFIEKIEKIDSQVYQMTPSIINPKIQSLELIKKSDVIQLLNGEKV